MHVPCIEHSQKRTGMHSDQLNSVCLKDGQIIAHIRFTLHRFPTEIPAILSHCAQQIYKSIFHPFVVSIQRAARPETLISPPGTCPPCLSPTTLPSLRPTLPPAQNRSVPSNFLYPPPPQFPIRCLGTMPDIGEGEDDEECRG